MGLAGDVVHRAVFVAPGPGVAEPKAGQHKTIGGLRSAIGQCDSGQYVVRVRLGVFNHDIKVAVVVKNAGVQQLILEIKKSPTPALRHKISVWVLRLGVLIKHLHVAVGGGAVEIEVVFLDVFAVISLGSGQTEHALFQDRIFTVPQCQGETDILIAVRNPGDAVFAPAVGPTAGVIVRKIIPGTAVGAVVFAHGSPGSLAEIRSPFFPVCFAIAVFGKSLMFGCNFHISTPN